MNFSQLECFFALSQSLNFTQTAESQFITQSALSRQIASLEQELGVKLLNRTTRSVSLTPAGKIFRGECDKILKAYQEGIMRTLHSDGELVATLRLGVPVDSFEPLVVRLLKAVSAKYPGLNVELKFNSPTRLVQSLDQGQTEAIIASGRPFNKETRFLLLDRRQDHIILPQGHPLSCRSEIDFKELKNERFVAISRASSIAGYESLLSHAFKAGFSPQIVAQAESISSLLMMVACGMGITVLYKEHEGTAGEHAVFVPLKNTRLFNRYLIWNRSDDPAVDAFVDVARETFPDARLYMHSDEIPEVVRGDGLCTSF